MLSVANKPFILIIAMLNVVMLSVVMVSVVAPNETLQCETDYTTLFISVIEA